MPDDVIQVPGWSAKAWWSQGLQAWLVELVQLLPGRAVGRRGWLKAPDGDRPQTFACREDAWAAAAAFSRTPTVTRWWENPGPGVP